MDLRSASEPTEVTLVELDQSVVTTRDRVDTGGRWRYGLIVLPPLVVALGALSLMLIGSGTGPDSPTRGELETGSALVPLVSGMAGPSARMGAAPQVAEIEQAAPGTPAAPRPGAGREVTPDQVTRPTATQPEAPASGSNDNDETGHDRSASTSETSNGAVTVTAPLGRPTPDDDSGDDHHDDDHTGSTEPDDGCTVEVGKHGTTMHQTPNSDSAMVIEVPAGRYPVESETRTEKATWYLINVEGTVGWVVDKATTGSDCSSS